MKFEYDSNKSKINKQKHGVDFEEAKTIWDTDNVIFHALTIDEDRYMIIRRDQKQAIFVYIHHKG